MSKFRRVNFPLFSILLGRDEPIPATSDFLLLDGTNFLLLDLSLFLLLEI